MNTYSLNNTLIYVILYVRVRNCLSKSLIQLAYADDSLYLTAKKVCLLLKPTGVVSPVSLGNESENVYGWKMLPYIWITHEHSYKIVGHSLGTWRSSYIDVN
jgi:hypothetical protein